MDLLDGVSYLVFVALIAWRRKALTRIELWALLIVGHVVLLLSANRVAGFPDNELAGPVTPIAYAILDVGVVVLALRRRLRPWVAVLAVCLVHLPLIELPGFALRQARGRLMAPAPAGAQARLLYYSKLTRQRIYAVGVMQNLGPPAQYVAMVFERQDRGYALASEVWFVAGGGTMDRQTPGLPMILRWLVGARG